MNADVAYSFIMGMFPADIQVEIENAKKNMLRDPALSFSVFQENCTKVIINKNRDGHTLVELAALFYMWGINACAASTDPVVIEASKQCDKIRSHHKSITDKVNSVMKAEFDRILKSEDAHAPKIVDKKDNVLTANFGKKSEGN